MFLLDDLTDKATKSGLKEEALISIRTKTDKKVYNYLKSQKGGQDDEISMRSSFYSTMQGSCVGDELPSDLESNKRSRGFVQKLNIQNILDLSSQELKIVTEMKKFMQE